MNHLSLKTARKRELQKHYRQLSYWQNPIIYSSKRQVSTRFKSVLPLGFMSYLFNVLLWFYYSVWHNKLPFRFFWTQKHPIKICSLASELSRISVFQRPTHGFISVLFKMSKIFCHCKATHWYAKLHLSISLPQTQRQHTSSWTAPPHPARSESKHVLAWEEGLLLAFTSREDDWPHSWVKSIQNSGVVNVIHNSATIGPKVMHLS